MRHFGLRYVPLWLASLGFLCLTLTTGVEALTSISQSFATKSGLPLGSIVSLQKDTGDEVIAAGIGNADSILGVVINADTALLSLSSGQKNQVQVATSGIVQVLVSDINGPVTRGDHITSSPIDGVGMKASGNVRIVGIAQGDMANGSKQTYKEKGGAEKSVNVGDVPLLVNVAYFFKEPNKTLIPTAIQNVANAIAGREVSPVPIFISGAIFLIMMIIVAMMVYSMIRSSIISIGRNPMSQSAVYRDLIQLSALVLVILGVSVVSIYLILTKMS